MCAALFDYLPISSELVLRREQSEQHHVKLESPSPTHQRRSSPGPPSSEGGGGGFNGPSGGGTFGSSNNNDFSGMSSTTPNSSSAADCQQQEAENNAQHQAAKNAFLELQAQHNHLAGMAPHHMTGGGPPGSYGSMSARYGQMPGQQQLGNPGGGYPFSHMPQNSYAAAAAAATIAGYHHLSPYPSAQCPSPPRDGIFYLFIFIYITIEL